MTDDPPAAPRKRGHPPKPSSVRSLARGYWNESKSSIHRSLVLGRHLTPEIQKAVEASGIKQTNRDLMEILQQPTLDAQLTKLSEIAARKGRWVPTPEERWNATVQAFHRLDQVARHRFCRELIDAGYDPDDD